MDNDDDRPLGHGRKGGRKVPRKLPRPLDARQIDELALAYVARFATSAGRLSDYLKRKIRERGWDGESAPDVAPPDVAAVVARMVDLHYIDDAGFAQARGAGLMRRGYGTRRIAETLSRDGIEAPLIATAAGSEMDRRRAALAFAQRRRLGPFGRGSASGDNCRLDPATRARQVAAMMRAGHPLGYARAMVEAVSQVAAQQWVDEADDA
jgi:regulatory protein